MKNIVVVTGARSEYGILKPLLKRIVNSEQTQLQLVVTGMHLEEKYGYTYRLIEEDGFTIDRKIFMNLTNTTNEVIIRGMATLSVEFSDYLQETMPDLVIIVGDRYEMIPVANVSVLHGVPIAHLHGGEITLGNYDEFIRHSITKMSHLHLVSTEEYRHRVIQMGEQPDSVFNCGALGIQQVQDNLMNYDGHELSKLELHDEYFVVLFHPETVSGAEDHLIRSQIEELLSALRKVEKQCIFIGSNSDTGSDYITQPITDYVNKCKHDSRYEPSFPSHLYHHLVKKSIGLVGNSSSGLIEIPSLGIPTLNIGDRQKGRTTGESVINVPTEEKAILDGLNKLTDKSFREAVKKFPNPYYKENAAQKAFDFILQSLFSGITNEKIFYDLEYEKVKQ